jgi:hypothetical protein
MKLAVCVPPGACDAYGHLTRYAEKLAEIGAARSTEVEILRYTDDDFLARLFTNLADENCIVHFHSFLYDLKVHTTPAVSKVRHALDDCRARIIATVSDHPFSDFMQEMVRNAHQKTRFMVIDNTFPDEMRFINPALANAKFIHVPFVAPVSFEDEHFVDFDAREYDLVLPLFVLDTRRISLDSFLGNLGEGWYPRAVMGTYEQARTDLSQNPFHIFSACMRAETGAGLHDLRSVQPKAVPVILNMLSRLDGYVRHERRNRVITSLLRSVGDLKVAVFGKSNGLDVDENVRFIGLQRAPETAVLMANSKAVLNCSPSYPSNVHERVTVGMLYESCVITDKNPCLEENFSEGEYVAYEPDCELTIEDIFAIHDTREIARQSGQKARKNPRFSWHTHFDTLLEIAQA